MTTEETIKWLRERKPVVYADDIANKLESLLNDNRALTTQLDQRESILSQMGTLMKIHWRTK